MRNPIGAAALLLLAGQNLSMEAQAPAPLDLSSAAGRCSNEVLSLSLKAVKTPVAPRRMSDPAPTPVWEGLIEVRLKNVSNLIVHLEELTADWEYEISVLDISGRPVPMTEYGKKSTPGKIPRGWIYTGPVSSFDLSPLQETAPNQIYVSRIYKIEPGRAYTVRFKRDVGLPKVDQIGRAVEHPALTCSIAIPAGPLADAQ